MAGQRMLENTDLIEDLSGGSYCEFQLLLCSSRCFSHEFSVAIGPYLLILFGSSKLH